MDTISRTHRSWNMSQIRSENTKPELIVRKILKESGYKFSLHNKKLPAKPDIVLNRLRTVIFIHGCFWHHHKGCVRANLPKSNKKYWIPKIKRNIQRDKENIKQLKKLGWNAIIMWECRTKDPKNVVRLLKKHFKKGL